MDPFIDILRILVSIFNEIDHSVGWSNDLGALNQKSHGRFFGLVEARLVLKEESSMRVIQEQIIRWLKDPRFLADYQV